MSTRGLGELWSWQILGGDGVGGVHVDQEVVGELVRDTESSCSRGHSGNEARLELEVETCRAVQG